MYLLFLPSELFAQGVLRRPFREGKLVLVLFFGNSVIIDLDRVGLDFVHKKFLFDVCNYEIDNRDCRFIVCDH